MLDRYLETSIQNKLQAFYYLRSLFLVFLSGVYYDNL